MSDKKKEKDIVEEEYAEHEDDYVPPMGCGILGRYPVITILLFAATVGFL